MAFDGIVVSALRWELSKQLVGGRISKVYQPERDEITLTVKNRVDDQPVTARLLLSAEGGLPMAYLMEETGENPAVCPGFCMLLRKHIGGGRIKDIRQPGLERILEIVVEHLDEMGDYGEKRLIIEIMGKHSNIIFVDEKGMILDSIKHVSHMVSSVREVLPGREYSYPPGQDKQDPLTVDDNFFLNHIMTAPLSATKAIYTGLTGISPLVANQMCYSAGVDGGSSTAQLSMDDKERLLTELHDLRHLLLHGTFTPCIAYDGYTPLEFGAVTLTSYGEVRNDLPKKGEKGLRTFDSISEAIHRYYRERRQSTKIKQHSTDLRKLVATAVERTAKKLDLQQQQLKSTEKRDKYKVYGELLTAYGYGAAPGATEIVVSNYYDNDRQLTIPLDPTKSAMEVAKGYFARYNKLKRTYEALTTLVAETEDELSYLLTVKSALDFAETEEDIREIKRELTDGGYIRSKGKKGKKEEKSEPLHFVSSDGYDIFVGKNNYQNDRLTFQIASGDDLWFHAKQQPGSHVILRTNGAEELPDSAYEEAARLAAYYSSSREAPKVEIDYTRRRNLKKPPGAKPGYVIYHTNYSMTIEPDIHGIREA